MDKLISGTRVWVVTALVIVFGCTSTGRVRTTPSPGVDRIPATVAMYPLLSGTEVDGQPWPIRLQTQGEREEIYIAPPTNSELSVTPSSQMLTGELSVQMARYGFDLREMPYEVREAYTPDGDDAYVVSLALLDELRERYGLDAIIVGNAFFMKKRRNYQPSETRVVAAYLKVIDTETLEVLCQVTMSYDAHGRGLNDLAQSMANHLASMAGLDVK